jgi:8-oxo-dGTP pyrophosphatase MutT (NUDIX family)
VLGGLTDASAPKNARLRASVVCEAQGLLLVVRLRDPKTGATGFYPPGGRVEAGETPADTARRETLEETGLRVRIDPSIELVEEYPFVWAGEERAITTHFFAATLEEPFSLTLPEVIDADYNLGASWMPVEEALAAMAVHPPIAAAVARVRRRMQRSSRTDALSP